MLPLQNLARRKVRTLFALLGIAVGISAVVSIVSTARGVRAQFYRIANQFAFDLIVLKKGAPSPMVSHVTAKDRKRVSELPHVKAVDTLTLNLLTRKDPTKPQPMIVLGLDPLGDILTRYEILKGRTLKADDTNKVLIGALAAQQNKLDVGSTLETLAGDYEIVGIFNAPVQGADFLSGQAIMNEAYIRDQFELPANLIVAHLCSAADVKAGKNLLSDPEVAAEIADIRSAIAADPKLTNRLEAKSFRDYLDSFKQTEIIDKFAWAMSFLAALVGGIGIANTMLMSVFERTREIGLLRAVGWSRTRIAVLIVLEGLALSILGGALGVPLGWLEVVAASKVVEMGWIQTAIDPDVAAKAVLLAVFIGVVGSLYPGLRAANLEPTEALRYE